MRRILPRLMLTLGIGLFISLAIAVTAAVRNDWKWTFSKGLTTINGRQYMANHWSRRTFDLYEVVSTHQSVWEQLELKPFPYSPPSWVTAPSGDVVETATLAYGWPLRCLRCGAADLKETRIIDGGEYVHVISKDWGMIQLGPRTPSKFSGSIPFVPIFSGLAGNTLMFSVIPLGVLVAMPAIRRAARRRRGLCVACGYDLRGLIEEKCPECGAAASATNK